jgi:hypothetical protein
LKQGSVATTTNCVHDGSDSIEETDQSGNLAAKYGRTTKIDKPLAESRSVMTDYYDADGSAQ